MKKRSLEYEKKFRKYLFSFDLKTHKEICGHINVKSNTQDVEKKGVHKSTTIKENDPTLTKVTPQNLIKDIIKGAEKDKGILTEDIIKKSGLEESEVKKIIRALLIEGWIYEPKINRLRWLG